MNQYEFIIEEEYVEERIDKVLALLLPSYTRSYLQKIIKDGSILVNSVAVKASYKVQAYDCISVHVPEAGLPEILPEAIPLSILYEDAQVIVIDKPKNMVVHPAPGHYTGTLVNAILYHCRDELSGINGIMRPGIVHRIDKDTTGSLIICKNDTSHQCIANQLKEHSILRKYRAIVYGSLKEEKGTICAPIGRHKSDRKKMAIVSMGGKDAITHYHVLYKNDKYSYIECQLETGRTHQIRVHMASIGHPLVGDTTYTNRPSPCSLEGQSLHAYELGFIHPTTNESINLIAPLPQYFMGLLNKLNLIPLDIEH